MAHRRGRLCHRFWAFVISCVHHSDIEFPTMTIEFKKQIIKSRFLDPARGFKETSFDLEIRRDPLTESASLIYHGMDYPPLSGPNPAELQRPQGCPFCPDNIEKATPLFPEDIVPGGRIRVNEAVVVPNIRPYSQYSAVVPMSSRHVMKLDELKELTLTDAFVASKLFAANVAKHDPEARYLSTGWNYMAAAGATLTHPHLQVNLGSFPTPAQARDNQAAIVHYEKHGANFWEELIQQEKEQGERYVGATGNVHWLTAFAPRSRLLDVIAVFRGASSFLDLSQADLRDFSVGLVSAFKDMQEHGLHSFNLAIHSSFEGNEHFYCHARLIARFTFFAAGVSDRSYLELLDGQMFSRITPEKMCQSLRKHFSR
ncbi:MAG: hypothetical protein HY673_20505 [Chloroflexi bacterium]|nr:hypothetical protein [Chloroflexota bacterium]